MRLVVAVVKPSEVESVRQALAAVQVTRMTVCDAHGYGPLHGSAVVQETMLEIAVNDDFLERTVAAVTTVLDRAADATSRLFVLPAVDAVQLYRSVRGPEAV